MGLIGSGGSILSLPIFVYLFGINPVIATAYSLFTVGLTSFIGSIKNIKLRLIHVNTVIYFSTSAAFSVYITRKYIIELDSGSNHFNWRFNYYEGKVFNVIFSILIFFAGIAMIRNRKDKM